MHEGHANRPSPADTTAIEKRLANKYPRSKADALKHTSVKQTKIPNEQNKKSQIRSFGGSAVLRPIPIDLAPDGRSNEPTHAECSKMHIFVFPINRHLNGNAQT